MTKSYEAGSRDLIFRGLPSLNGVEAYWFGGKVTYNFHPGKYPGTIVHTIADEKRVLEEISNAIRKAVESNVPPPWWNPAEKDQWRRRRL